MTKDLITGSQKRIFHVILDTNIVEGGFPIHDSVTDFIESAATEKRVELKYYLPEVVFRELKKHVLEKVSAARDNFNKSTEVLAKLDIATKQSISVEKIKLVELIKKRLTDSGFEIIPTPITDIDLDELIEKAIYYKPPFQKTGEKGFKDSIIAQTMDSFINGVPEGEQVVLITNDQALRKYLIEQYETTESVAVHANLPEFESNLKLSLYSPEDEQRFKALVYEAQNEFIQKGDKSLYSREGIEEKIKAKYSHLFTNPDMSSLFVGFAYVAMLSPVPNNYWVAISNGSFYVTDSPIFVDRKLNEFEWTSTVVYRQKFVNYTTNTFVGYRLEFLVKWSSKLNADGKITESSIKEIQHVNTLAAEEYTPPNPQRSPYEFSPSWVTTVTTSSDPTAYTGPASIAFASAPTVSGQGTIPVTQALNSVPINDSLTKPLSYSLSPSASPSLAPEEDE